MAVSTDINLPRSHTARFPDRCVVCDRSEPGSHVRVVTGSIGWWTWMLWWFGKPLVVKAPACASCAWKLHGLRLLSLLVTIGIVLAVLFFIWPYLEESVPRGLRKWAGMGLALACILPQIVFEVYFAKPFDVTAFTDSVDYEFTSNIFAIEFLKLNQDAEWIKLNGQIVDMS